MVTMKTPIVLVLHLKYRKCLSFASVAITQVFAKYDGVGTELFQCHGRQEKTNVFHYKKIHCGNNVKQFLSGQSFVERLSHRWMGKPKHFRQWFEKMNNNHMTIPVIL